MASLRKTVLITGCSQGGIGEGLSKLFLEKGYHVFPTIRNPSRLSSSLSDAANVTPISLDVLSSESIAAAVESVQRETGGRLDVLVNNAGANLFLPALDTSIEDSRKLFDVNFFAPMAVLQAFAPLLIKAKGCVVNNSSAGYLMPMPFLSTYNASKAALASASETWRHELEPLGVRTITLITLAVKTDYFAAENRRTDIPETSLYYKIRDFIYGLTDGRLQASGISARDYALKVVGEIERGTVGPVWAGGDALVARIGWAISPQFVRDMMIQSFVPLSKEWKKVSRTDQTS